MTYASASTRPHGLRKPAGRYPTDPVMVALSKKTTVRMEITIAGKSVSKYDITICGYEQMKYHDVIISIS